MAKESNEKLQKQKQKNKALRKHEALHTAYLAADMVDRHLLQDEIVKKNKSVHKKVKKAMKLLYDVYQGLF